MIVNMFANQMKHISAAKLLRDFVVARSNFVDLACFFGNKAIFVRVYASAVSVIHLHAPLWVFK